MKINLRRIAATSGASICASRLIILASSLLVCLTNAAPSSRASQESVPSNLTSEARVPKCAYNNNNSPEVSNCSSAEFTTILQKIVQNEDTLSKFKEFDTTLAVSSNVSLSVSFDSIAKIRPTCVRELFELIKNLASNELELKTMLEFASDAPRVSSNSKRSLANLNSSKFKEPRAMPSSETPSVQAGELDSNPASKLKRLLSIGRSKVELVGSRLNFADGRGASGSEPCGERNATEATSGQLELAATKSLAGNQVDHSEASVKSRTLNKALTSVENWIAGLESFTLTRQWSSILKIFQGGETILSMFLPSGNSSSPKKSQSSNKTLEQHALLETFQRQLPSQVLSLTRSLNSLFPWHVWPWNNVDLYASIDTFLNHGIFAFAKTTVGPQRRIEHLSEMLQTLFKSLKLESFPTRCYDWSRIICDRELFFDKLVLPAEEEESGEKEREARRAKVKELAGERKNQLTQELSCIMFSSLSVQHFGAKEDLEVMNVEHEHQQMLSDNEHGKLSWDQEVSKAIRLYGLAREALSDEQWMSLYSLIKELWSQQKVSQRVIMVGRVIQLITSCHMPKEMLESALWKDIYKYKNVLNQLVDVVTDELNRSSQTGSLKVEQISLGSLRMQEIIEKFLRVLPKLVESLSRTVVDQLPDLVNSFFQDKAAFFRVPCKGYSFAEIIPSLGAHSFEIMEIEELVCRQLKIKPNITMSQINNLMSNDFFAMALNLTKSERFQKMLTLELPANQRHESHGPAGNMASGEEAPKEPLREERSEQAQAVAGNSSSVVDEMAANPRLAQIVAILQSSALDPPEVHAELPELNWVEAGTSVALLYDAIQKVLSHEQPFSIFPEIQGFQEEIGQSVESSQQMFLKFSKRDPMILIAYGLDTLMPIALRTFKPMESFNQECSSSSLLKDLFSDETGSPGESASGQQASKVSRQWQCFVSSLNFASWATNNFMRTFNSMFKNVLAHKLAKPLKENLSNNSNCIFFDGTVSLMLDNLPQFMDLSLETVLMASTSLDPQASLYDIMCSSNYILDPFNERALELKAKMKDKMCQMFHKKSLENCANVIELNQWSSTMAELNSTWFEAPALSLTPSFRNITMNGHKFLELAGQFKPSAMTDSLIARILNVNSFWTNFLNKTISIIDKYQEKRFEYALQTLTPIIYDNLSTPGPVSAEPPASNESSELSEVRETLTTTILGAKAVLGYLERQSRRPEASRSPNKTQGGSFDAQMESLFGWADAYSIPTAEVLLHSLASNISKLEFIFALDNATSSRLTRGHIWDRFCLSPADKFLSIPGNDSELNVEKFVAGKEEICNFKWEAFHEQLCATDQQLKELLARYPARQLTRMALTKWGQVLDFMFIESKNIKHLPKFFYMNYWDHFRARLSQISPWKEQPSNLNWIWQGVEQMVRALDAGTNQTNQHSLTRILEQLNCGLESVKGGLSWENIANIYSDKQDILAAHSTINNGFALASIGLNTFVDQKKFQRFLDEFVKPQLGLGAFCEFRDRSQLHSIFSVPDQEEFIEALVSFQELLCDTNFDSLAQNINPISVCYQTGSTNNTPSAQQQQNNPLADTMDRFFKLASLAVLDAKLVAASDTKPPILDKDRWSSLWNSWFAGRPSGPAAGFGLAKENRVALAIVRAFQTVNAINAEHVVWKALFRSIHELSELTAYLLRAIELREPQEEQLLKSLSFGLGLVKEAQGNHSELRSNPSRSQQQLATTLSVIMFPEVNNFISFRTFKQLRYIRSIWDYFRQTVGAQELVCSGNHSAPNNGEEPHSRAGILGVAKSRLELINYNLNSNDKVSALLCQYEPSQWLTVLNIVISSKTSSIPKKVDYMTKYMSIMAKHYRVKAQTSPNANNGSIVDSANLEQNLPLDNFLQTRQLENIEFVANSSLSHILATSQSIKSLSFTKITNISWHSMPNILDSIDKHLCASKYELGTFQMGRYEPKRVQLDTIVCKLPQWNMTQIYDYVNENFDLQNMISLMSITQQQQPDDLAPSASNSSSVAGGLHSKIFKASAERTCVTPFKFASRWLRIVQETVDEFMSKSKKDKIKRCLKEAKKGRTAYTEFMRYIRYVNILLSSIDELTINNSWPSVKKAWSSFSQSISNRNQP